MKNSDSRIFRRAALRACCALMLVIMGWSSQARSLRSFGDPDHSGTPGLQPAQLKVCQAYNKFLSEAQSVSLPSDPPPNALASEYAEAEKQEKINARAAIRFKEIKSALGGDGSFHDWVGTISVGSVQNLMEEVRSAAVGKRIATLHDTHVLFTCPGERALTIGFGMSLGDPRSIRLDSPVALSMRSLKDGSLVSASGKMDCETPGCIPDQSPFTVLHIGRVSLYFVAQFTHFSAVESEPAPSSPSPFVADSATLNDKPATVQTNVSVAFPPSTETVSTATVDRLTVVSQLDFGHGLLVRPRICSQTKQAVICKMEVTSSGNYYITLDMRQTDWRSTMVDASDRQYRQTASYLVDVVRMGHPILFGLPPHNTVTLVQEFASTSSIGLNVRLLFSKSNCELDFRLSN